MRLGISADAFNRLYDRLVVVGLAAAAAYVAFQKLRRIRPVQTEETDFQVIPSISQARKWESTPSVVGSGQQSANGAIPTWKKAQSVKIQKIPSLIVEAEDDEEEEEGAPQLTSNGSGLDVIMQRVKSLSISKQRRSISDHNLKVFDNLLGDASEGQSTVKRTSADAFFDVDFSETSNRQQPRIDQPIGKEYVVDNCQISGIHSLLGDTTLDAELNSVLDEVLAGSALPAGIGLADQPPSYSDEIYSPHSNDDITHTSGHTSTSSGDAGMLHSQQNSSDTLGSEETVRVEFRKSAITETSMKTLDRWSAEEDALLVQCVKQHGNQWKAMEKYFHNRNHEGLRKRWKKMKKQKGFDLMDTMNDPTMDSIGIKRHNGRDWTNEEDVLLCELVPKYGSNWKAIAPFFPGRTDEGVRNYWKRRTAKENKTIQQPV